jgi:transcription antitermination factor NusG
MPMAAENLAQPRWHVLWTHSHCEQLVHDQLLARGYQAFLPRLSVWSRRRGLRCLSRVPMFPGYLFLNHAMSKRAYIEVRGVRGLVRILGEGWDRLAAVPDPEVSAIRALSDSSLPAQPHPFTREGQRVRIVSGPLRDVEGTLVSSRPDKGLLVLSVSLLRRSVSVHIDSTDVVPA